MLDAVLAILLMYLFGLLVGLAIVGIRVLAFKVLHDEFWLAGVILQVGEGLEVGTGGE